MPVILRKDDYELWLDPGMTNGTLVAECLKPFHSGLMNKYPVSTRVNRTENDGPDCALEVPIAATAQTLF
jgi:putative SOS response-associated peptidase YedK